MGRALADPECIGRVVLWLSGAVSMAVEGAFVDPLLDFLSRSRVYSKMGVRTTTTNRGTATNEVNQ
jgi:hypothetical protein